MRLDFEEVLLRNAPLTAAAFWHLSRSYMNKTVGEAPELPHFLIGGGMLFHANTVEKVHRMNFDSGFIKMIAEKADLISDLQSRIENNSLLVMRGLQVGCASRILAREGGPGFPRFRAEGANLPPSIRTGDESVPALFNAAKRLGFWLAQENVQTLAKQLRIVF